MLPQNFPGAKYQYEACHHAIGQSKVINIFVIILSNKLPHETLSIILGNKKIVYDLQIKAFLVPVLQLKRFSIKICCENHLPYKNCWKIRRSSEIKLWCVWNWMMTANFAVSAVEFEGFSQGCHATSQAITEFFDLCTAYLELWCPSF